MFNIQEKLRERLAKNNINKLWVWEFILQIVSSKFNKKYEINWFVKNWILFIKTSFIWAKTEIFLKKKVILEEINNKLEKFWYKIAIKDIVIK